MKMSFEVSVALTASIDTFMYPHGFNEKRLREVYQKIRDRHYGNETVTILSG